MKPLVSIIIPTYNRAHLIGETLDSVIAQTYGNYECIVVDDGSSDYIEELMYFYCDRHHNIKYYSRKKFPKGASQCRNFGLQKSNGDYCIFLDSDDLLLKFCLEKRVEYVVASPEKEFYVFPMLIENANNTLREAKIPAKTDFLKEFLSYNIHWGIMCTLWRRSFLLKLGGFRPGYPRLNDPEIHIRAMLESNNYFVCTDGQADSIYRIGAVPKNRKEFAQKYYKTLLMFIPDIVDLLKVHNRKKQIPLLKAYLYDFMRISFRFIKREENLSLFKISYRSDILTYMEYLKLSVNYNLFLSFNVLLKRRRNSIDAMLKSKSEF